MGIGQCIDAITTMPGTITGFLAMGLFGGLTHCAAMCGPFVLAQTSRKTDVSETILSKLSGFSLLPYHLGRGTTYIFLAVLFSSLLNLAFLFLPIRLFVVIPLLFLAATVFLVAAFPSLSSLFPWAATLHLPIPLKKFTKYTQNLMTSSGAANRYVLGILLGFMPCGLLLAALMAAASLDNPLKSAIAMAAFTAGTVPALFGVALGGQTIRTLYPDKFLKIRQGFLILSAVWLFVLAGITIF